MAKPSPEMKLLLDELEVISGNESNKEYLTCCNACLDYLACCLNPVKKCTPTLAVPRTEELQHAREWSLKLIVTSHFSLLFTGKASVGYLLLTSITAIVLFAFALPPFVEAADIGHMPALIAVRMSLALLSLILVVIDIAVRIWFITKDRKTVTSGHNTYDISVSTENLNILMIKAYLPDVLRLQGAELMVYATVICNILSNASGRYYNDLSKMSPRHEKLEFAGLIIALIFYAIHAFAIYLCTIIKGIVSLEQLRRGKGYLKFDTEFSESDDNDREKSDCCKHITQYWKMFSTDLSSTNRSAITGFLLEVFYVFHILFQIVAQIFCLAAIWSKVTCENPLPTSFGVLYVSPFTWVMIILGFILPNKILASFTFYVSTFVWAKEFCVVFMINILSVFTKTTDPSINESTRAIAKRRLQSIDHDMTENQLKCCEKFFYPWCSPLLSIISSIYYIALISFPIFSVVGARNPQQIDCFDPNSYILSENLIACNFTSNLFIFFIVSVVLVWIFNFIVVSIGIWWVVIVPSIIILIIVTVLSIIAGIVAALAATIYISVAVIFFICVCLCLAGGDSHT